MKNVIFWMAFAFGVGIILPSCGSMKKNRSESKSFIDMTSVSKAQETEVKKDNSSNTITGATEVTGNKLRMKIIYSDAEPGKMNIQTVELPTGFNNQKVINSIANSLFNSRMKALELEIDGGFKFKDSLFQAMQNALYDSISKLKSDSTRVIKETKTVNENKERKGLSINVQLVLWLLIAIAALLFFMFKRAWFVQIFIKIKNYMKKFLIMSLLLAITFISCSQPDGKIHKSSTEWNGSWDMGKQVMVDYVVIKPTWSQSFYFALKDGYAVDLFLSIFLFVAAIVSLYFVIKQMTKERWQTIACYIIAAIGIVGGAIIFYSTPGRIHSDTTVKIEKMEYERYKNDLPALWDKLYADKKIIGTSGQ